MDYDTFLNLEMAEVAQIVQSRGLRVCAFIFNGTRRWFILEHAQPEEDFALAYLEATSKRLVELSQLLFDHGIQTLLLPAFNPQLMARGERYVKMMGEGLSQLTSHPRFLDFYEAYDVRVRFYGEHRQCLANTPYAHLSEQFDQVTARTLAHTKHQLLFGICAHDATETLAALAVRYYQEHGKIPDKQALVEMYYGEYIPPANLFIGSGKLHASDMPLMTVGKEQLYFCVAPAFYLDQVQLRTIFYDYLYARTAKRVNYEALQPEDWMALRQFFQANQGKTLGVGARNKEWDMWHPTPQVTLPEGFLEE
ncbi:hypothetical protein [Candidatus Leptofilum sp.]|uniref:hypothetical protein n=1 Tax=Candidatus Leptofilum sp. TaxID=3241576 RepID=UPI003B5A18F2